MRARILIIDDDEQMRSLLKNLLAQNHDCTLSSSAEEAMRVLRASKFALVISDINMSSVSGSDLVPYVLNKTPDTVVVLISARRTIDAAIQAIREDSQGETDLSPPISAFTIMKYSGPVVVEGFPLQKLTARQTQVLRLIADGKTTKQVALELNISVKTVESHRMQLMDRLEIHDIAGLVRFAIRVGLVRLED